MRDWIFTLVFGDRRRGKHRVDAVEDGFAKVCEMLGMEVVGDGTEVIHENLQECDGVEGGLKTVECI